MASYKSKMDTAAPSFTPSKSTCNKSNKDMVPSKQNPSRRTQKPRYPQQQPRGRQSDYNDEFDLNLEEQVLSGNVKVRGKRAQISISHLLDFSLPERDLETLSKPQRRRRKSSNNGDERIHLSGQEFINANYKFIVDARGDYRSQIADPNCILDGSSILRVIVPRGYQCPICLSEDIVAPRMISCGHIFCATCLLRFLASEQIVKKGCRPRKLKDCPLCSLPVRPDETKLVLIDPTLNVDIPQINHSCELKLMARPIHRILPVPYEIDVNRDKLGNLPWYCDADIYPYARIMKGGLKFAADALETERVSIKIQQEEDKLLYNNDNDTYVDMAIADIDFKLELLKTSFDDNYDEPSQISRSMDELSIQNNELNESNTFFFYQTAFNNKTKYFLAPLDVKVLVAAFGTYSQFPPTLEVIVENVIYGHTVSPSVLKRMKFLSHLPLGTEFALLEIDWKHSIDPDVYRQFAKELQGRKRKLVQRLKKEDTDKKRYETEQEERAKQFYLQERSDWGSSDFLQSTTSFAIETPRETENDDLISDSDHGKDYTTTVWGTRILKNQDASAIADELDDPFHTEEILKSVSTMKPQKGKKKKRIVLMSSQSSRAA